MNVRNGFQLRIAGEVLTQSIAIALKETRRVLTGALRNSADKDVAGGLKPEGRAYRDER